MIRKAFINEVTQIQRLLNHYGDRGILLPRSLSELYEHLRDFYVIPGDDGVIAVCALGLCWEDLAEIRSLCVAESSRKKGIGRMLVDVCIEEAKQLNIPRIFLLTYQEVFFAKCDFTAVDKKELPQKIWSDCIRCPKFPECDEIAMIRHI